MRQQPAVLAQLLEALFRDQGVLVREGGESVNADLQREIRRAERERLETIFAFQIKAAGLPEPERQVLFHPTRQWRWDFGYPDIKLAIDLQGGVWTAGAHTRGRGYTEDCVKQAEAVILGWRVLHFTGGQVEDGVALTLLERALGLGSPGNDQSGLYGHSGVVSEGSERAAETARRRREGALSGWEIRRDRQQRREEP